MRKQGFTLVELLVVIAIIGTLVGLLLPAVQAAREAARRLSCQSNIRQMSLAVLSYENAKRIFPAAYTHTPGYDSSRQCCDPAELTNLSTSWVVLVLPFMEEQPLRAVIDISKPMSDPANARARGTVIKSMVCPTDTYAQQPFNGTSAAVTSAMGDGWARGCYGANGSLGIANCTWIDSAGSAVSPYWQAYPGIMGADTAFRVRQVSDGMTKTALLGEMRAGILDIDPRGVWALGKGSSSLWGHGGVHGDDGGPNNLFYESDDVYTAIEMMSHFGGYEETVRLGMPIFSGAPDRWINHQQTARSMHYSGVFISMADGSVRWVNDDIQVVPSTPQNLSVWDRLMVSNDGQAGAAE